MNSYSHVPATHLSLAPGFSHPVIENYAAMRHITQQASLESYIKVITNAGLNQIAEIMSN